MRRAGRRVAGFCLAGVVLAVVSACAQGGGAVLSRKAFAVLHAHGFFMDAATSAYQRALGGLAVGALALIIVRRWPAAERKPTTESAPVPAMAVPPWIWVVLNTLLGPVLGVTCYQWALRDDAGRSRAADRRHRPAAHRCPSPVRSNTAGPRRATGWAPCLPCWERPVWLW